MSALMQTWTAERIAGVLNKAKRSPTGWKACCPAHEDADPSLFIADGDDGIAMRCYAGCSYRDIAEALKTRGVELFPSRDRREIPTEHFQLGGYHSHWDYHDASGRIVMRVCRWEQPNNKKDIRPLVRAADGWKWQHHPTPRPLFQLDRLVNDADLPALVVEGEKTAVAAQKLFPQYIATTWAGGASSIGQTDWVPLSGRDVVLIPDCDAPGRKAMQWLSNYLGKSARSVRTVDPADFASGLFEGWDLADALAENRDVSSWLEKKNDEPQPGAIEAIPFSLEMLQDIPPRKWLYRRHYMRGMVSLTAAAGGVGKSTVQLVEAISMVLGEDLLRNREPLKVGPLRVWLHNGEDPLIELRRRIAAVVKHYEIDAEKLVGNLLLTSGRDTPIIAAQEMDGVTVLIPDTKAQVLAQIQKWGVSTLVLDPFVSTHRVSENSNSAIEPVMTLWRDIADKADIAVEIIHHFRKGNGATEPSADDVRGATAMIGAARTVRLFAAMTKDEAEVAAIDPKHRRRYIWEMNAKANMHAPTDERTWRELIGVSLENSDDVNDADEVGVAVSWEFPSLYSALTPMMERAALRAIGAEMDWDKRRKAKQSKNWVGFLIAETLGWDGSDVSVKRNIGQLLDKFEEQKQVVIRTIDDPRQGRKIPVYEVAKNDPQ